MLVNITFKDPDSLDDAIDNAVAEDIKTHNLSRAECDDIADNVRTIARKWFKYGEYLTVQIDTEADTCTVVEAR